MNLLGNRRWVPLKKPVPMLPKTLFLDTRTEIIYHLYGNFGEFLAPKTGTGLSCIIYKIR